MISKLTNRLFKKTKIEIGKFKAAAERRKGGIWSEIVLGLTSSFELSLQNHNMSEY